MLGDLADIFTVVGGAAIALLLLPAALAIWQYRRNSRTQRAQWLLSLFERFTRKTSIARFVGIWTGTGGRALERP